MTQTGSAIDSEWSLLRVCCSDNISAGRAERVRQLLQHPVQWSRLIELAEKHGLQPILYRTISEVPEAIPQAQLQLLQQIYQLNLHKSLFLSRELIRIMDHLRSAGLDALPYKGVAVAEAYYGDIALRPTGDIDLLILEPDLVRIRDSVKELGYTPHWSFSPMEEAAFLKSGYECAFDGPAGPNLLEAQWDLQPKFYAVDFDMKGLFSRAITTTIAGYPMKTPAAEDQVIILSLHASKHVWGRLIWLCDIAHAISIQNLDWHWISAQAKRLGIIRILRVAALLANRLVGCSIPSGLDKHLQLDAYAETLATEIEDRIRSSSGYNVESFEYFRLMLRLRERSLDRLRFVSRLILTPGPSEWQCVRLPRPLSPLYRFVRLYRLGAKIIPGRRL